MREEYELGKLKVKRRGPLPAFQEAAGRPVTGEELRPEQAKAIKAALLEDQDFLQALAHRIEEREAR